MRRRHSGKLLTPRRSPFAAWTAYVRRAAERLGGVKIGVIPTEDAPPAKPRPRRKSRLATKRRRRVTR